MSKEIRLLIEPKARKKIVKELSLDPEIAGAVSKMGLSMEPPGSEREVKLAEYLKGLSIRDEILEGKVDAAGKKELETLLKDKIWEKEGAEVISLVKDRLNKRGLEYTYLDVVVITFMIAGTIILGKEW